MRPGIRILRALVLLAVVCSTLALLDPSAVRAAPDILNPDPGGGDELGGGCTVRDCTTTYTGPLGVECCCFYDCPSGGTWVCKEGVYCPA